MKKQESGKKNLKWILLGAALVVALVALALILILGGNSGAEPEEPLSENIKLYWNVDRKDYVAKGANGASGRMARSDGYFWVRFAVEGEQIDIPVADRGLVDQIDMLDVMGLVLDDEGVVIDVLAVQEFTGGLAADHYYVEAVDGTAVTCNTSGLFKGVSTTIQVPETANIYDVGGVGLLVGMQGTIQLDDEIIAIMDENGTVTDVFVISYQMPGDIYWNVTRMYNSTTKMTTRETNLLGYYEFQMCYGGELVTLKTRDMDIASAVDSFVARCMGLEFDEEGYIIGTKTAASVTGGMAVGSWFHVTDINGEQITMEKIASGSDQGTITTATFGRYCKTVLTTTGEYTEVQLGDQVHCLADARGRLAYIFVISRPSPTAKIYWNVERQYDSTGKVTKRVPSSDGYYHITLACDGKQVTLKTKDKDIATKIDSYAAKCFALEVEGDEIISVHGTGVATGGNVALSWYHVDSIKDGSITGTKRTDENSSEYGQTVTKKMAEDCKVYNVSSSAMMVGEETTVQLDDQIHCLTNYKGEIKIVFVVTRPVSSKIYYNLERLYDSEKKETNREKAEDGYYYFLMAVDGKQVTLKTKDKELANQIDASAARCMGLSLKGDVIQKMYSTSSVKGYTGGVEVSYCDVTKISGRTVTAERTLSGADQGKKYTVRMTSKCQVYDVSGAHVDHAGEATTLRLGDRIHCLRDKDNNTVLIYVVARKIQGKVGWNVSRSWDSENKTTKRIPDAQGWYYIDMAIDGQIQTLKTQDIELINAIDSQAAMCRGLVLDGDVIKRVVSPSSVIGTDGGVNGSWVNVTEVTDSGCKAIKVGGAEDGTTYDIPMAKDCKVYNVSSVVKSHKGEETTLKYGAVIHALINTEGDATIIYVITDGIEGATQGYCNVCKQNVTWAAWNGSDAMVNNVHYYLEEDIHMDTYTTLNGSNVTLFLNGHTITSDSRAFKLTNSAVLNIYDSKEDGKDIGGKIIAKGITAEEIVAENNGNASEGGVVMMWNSNVTLNLYSGTLQLASENNGVKNGGVVTGAGVFNMYGGSVIGSKVSNHGGSVRLFGAKARFNLYDGTVSGGQAAHGGNITADNGATVNIKGGTVTGGVAVNGTADVNGGNLYLIKSAANISGGTITGGQAAHGGNIAVTGTSTLTMTGGTVTEGKAVTLASVGNGGNIYVSGGSTGSVTGGTVTKGEARRGGNFAVFGDVTVSNVTVDAGTVSHDGACFFIYNQGKLTLSDITVPAAAGGKQTVAHSGTTLTVSGKIVLPLVAVNNTTVVIGEGGLADDSAIGVKDNNIATAFATVSEETDKDCFYSVSEDYTVEMDENKALYLKSTAKPHVHCVCGGQAVGVGDHTSCEDEEWIAWTDATKLPTASGNYYLTTDVSFSTSITTEIASDIGLCLNGHTVRNNERIWLKGNFTVTDCTGNGAIVSTFARHTAIFYTYELCQLRLYAGTLDGSGAGQNYGVVSLCNDNVDDDGVNEPSYFYMYGGTIKGRNTGTVIGGGAVQVMLNTQFHMYGGTITGGQSVNGGGIYVSNNTGVVNIQGGTITGNKSNKGGAIYASTLGASITVSGDAQIIGNTNAAGTAENNIYLISGQTLTLGQLDETAKIGITMEMIGDIANNVTADLSQIVTSDSESCVVVYNRETQKLYMEAGEARHKDHCVCGGHAVGVGDHSTCENEAWTAWEDASNLPTAAGNYYLTCDVSVGKITTDVDADIKICLNGWSITTSGGIWTRGDMAITDCGSQADWGTVYSTRAGHSAVLYSYERCNVQLFAGTLDATQAGTNQSGAVSMASDNTDGDGVKEPSYFRMYGGTIIGRNANTANGGGVWLMHVSEFHMYGGTITGATGAKGSAVYVGDNATAYLYGGEITGNKTTNYGAVYGENAQFLTVSGDVQIIGNTNADGTVCRNVYLRAGQTLTLGEMDGAKLGITMEEAGDIATGVTADLSKQITSDAANKAVAYDAAAQKLYLADGHTHCLCGGNAEGVGDHTDCTPVVWTELTQDMFDAPDGTIVTKGASDLKSMTVYTLAPGSYCLTEDITVDAMIELKGTAVSLCLNGCTITGESRMFRLRNSGSVSITDCTGNGEMVAKGLSDADGKTEQGTDSGGRIVNEGGVIMMWSDNTVVNIYSGTVRLATAEEGGSSNIRNGGVITGAGVVNMYGGTVTGGRTTNDGGNIRLYNVKAGLNLYGGSISGGKASNVGGNISVHRGTMVMTGGTVLDGQAKEGGNIVNYGAGTVTISGGAVENGAAVSGGNLGVFGKLTVTGDAIIRDGTATATAQTNGGGNIYAYANSADISITGGQITNGKAATGANILVRSSSTVAVKLSITGGTVSGVRGDTHSVVIHDAGTLTPVVGGTAVIDDLHLFAGKTLAVADGGFKEGAKIGVSLAGGTGTVATNVTTDLSGWFESSDAAYEVKWEDNKLVLKAKTE